MQLSVLIPTYKRPESLRRCLEGIYQQERAADEVLVVTQATDEATKKLLLSFSHLGSLRVLELSRPGAVAQYNAGLEAMKGDVVAITDDDTVPRPDWLGKICRHFEQHPDLGGVGGLDRLHVNGTVNTGQARPVGVVQWFGRIVGNHHLGADFYPSVEILKGANMAFRATAIKDLYFDTDLRGAGAQTSLDLGFSLRVRKRGWRLLYDPAVVVDHFPAARFDSDQRDKPGLEAVENTSFNLYLTLLRHMPAGVKRRMAIFWVRTVGVRMTPGLLRAIPWRLTGNREKLVLRAAANRAWGEAKRIAASH